MAGRPAAVTQAEIARAIRAAKAEGLTILRVVARPDGFAIETEAAPAGDTIGAPVADQARPVL
jgi:hypothetical protein